MLTTELSDGDILFIDEIHRLNPAVEEALYPAMEDFTFFINTGKGAGSTTLKLAVPRFTLVGATTRSGLLTGPLRDRFGIVFNLGFYEIPEITDILERSARLPGQTFPRHAAHRQPPAAPRTGFCPSKGQRHYYARHRPNGNGLIGY